MDAKDLKKLLDTYVDSFETAKDKQALAIRILVSALLRDGIPEQVLLWCPRRPDFVSWSVMEPEGNT